MGWLAGLARMDGWLAGWEGNIKGQKSENRRIKNIPKSENEGAGWMARMDGQLARMDGWDGWLGWLAGMDGWDGWLGWMAGMDGWLGWLAGW